VAIEGKLVKGVQMEAADNGYSADNGQNERRMVDGTELQKVKNKTEGCGGP